MIYKVNLDVLSDGKVFKNYKELARAMGWKPASGINNTYHAQMKQLSSVCRWRKDVDSNGKKLSNKIIIEEVYQAPLPIVDKRKEVGLRLDLPGYCVPEEYSKSKGIYRIILNDEVYIGSTGKGFRKRFLSHLTGNQPHTKDLIDRGGRFELVEVMDSPTKAERLAREAYYIDWYLKNESYIVINQRLEIAPCEKIKYRRVMVSDDDYEKVLALLKEHGIHLKPTKSKGVE